MSADNTGYRPRSLAVSDPALWNSLPVTVLDATLTICSTLVIGFTISWCELLPYCNKNEQDNKARMSTNSSPIVYTTTEQKHKIADGLYNKNLAIANRSRVSCINTNNNNTIALKSGLEVTQGH